MANASRRIGLAAGRKDLWNGALGYRGHPGVWPVLLDFTRVGVVRRSKAPLDHELSLSSEVLQEEPEGEVKA